MNARLVRVVAAAATIEAYLGRGFAWGDYDCLHLVTHCLKRLGYAPDFDKAGAYNTRNGALRALRRAGFRTTEEAIDDLVGEENRIDPLAAVVGDVLGFSDELGILTAMSVSVGSGKVLGFQHDDICRIFSPNYGVEGATYVAWRCDPCLQLQRPSAVSLKR